MLTVECHLSPFLAAGFFISNLGHGLQQADDYACLFGFLVLFVI